MYISVTHKADFRNSILNSGSTMMKEPHARSTPLCHSLTLVCMRAEGYCSRSVCVCACVCVYVRVCTCVCVCKCNICECYSAVLVVRLTYMYTSTKTCIKNEWHDYGEYIYPLSISKQREGYALSKCFSLLVWPVYTSSINSSQLGVSIAVCQTN